MIPGDRVVGLEIGVGSVDDRKGTLIPSLNEAFHVAGFLKD